MNTINRIVALGLLALTAGCASQPSSPAAAAPGTAAAIPLFNGRDLAGWTIRGGQASFSVEDGTIVGRTASGQPNSFLCTDLTFHDFDLSLEFKVDKELNSGVQIRSQAKPAGSAEIVFGYQIEIDPAPRAWTGGLYDEARRGWLRDLTQNPAAQAAFKQGAWNTLRIRVQGDTFNTWLNGVPAVVDFKDSMTPEGFIGLQVHGVGARKTPLEIRWRKIELTDLSH